MIFYLDWDSSEEEVEEEEEEIKQIKDEVEMMRIRLTVIIHISCNFK